MLRHHLSGTAGGNLDPFQDFATVDYINALYNSRGEKRRKYDGLER